MSSNEQSRVQAFEGIEDKKKLVTGGDDGRLHLWNLAVAAPNDSFAHDREFDPQESPLKPIFDAQYFEQTDFFFTSDEGRKIKVYKLTGTIYTPFSVK